jgi:IrrE N-terminal-like domain
MALGKISKLIDKLQLPGNVAAEVRAFNFGNGPTRPPSVAGMARRLGFDVVEVGLPRNVRGQLVRDAFAANGYRIEVNKADNVMQRRWTVLHELVHAYTGRNDDLLASPQFRAPDGEHLYLKHELSEERFTNECVETIVFGDNALSGAVGLYGLDVSKLSRHFGVSEESVKIALSKL